MIAFTRFISTYKIAIFFFIGIVSVLGVCAPITKSFAQSVSQVSPQELDMYSGDTSHPVKLELRLIDKKTKLIGDGIVTPKSADRMSVIETTYTIRARAFGGDVYLPAYQEQIIFEPVFVTPQDGSNAVVLGTPSIHLKKNLNKKDDRYILKEYDEVDMDITVSLKVLHAFMPSRLVLKTKLNTLAWHPTVYANGSFDAGTEVSTGERLVNIPLINATYIPEQITRVDWSSEPVVLIKNDGYLKNQASVVQILRRLFVVPGNR